MCTSSVMRTVDSVTRAVTKPVGELVSGVANKVGAGEVVDKASKGLDYAEAVTSLDPVSSRILRAHNIALTGSDLADTKKEYENQMNYANEQLQSQIGDAPDPFNYENEEEYLAALRAKYREDARARRYRGRAGTILTGGQGASGTAPTNTPTLTGKRLRFF